ncbi:MAG: winged helix-turn-helix domain-containing protein, partial [Bdellovibrionota bacterium]
GLFKVDHSKQRISLLAPAGEISLELTTNEYKLLHYFICHEDHLLSRSQILDRVWGNDVHVSDRTVDSHIYSLRKKLGPASSFIETVPRSGYRFLQGKLDQAS